MSSDPGYRDVTCWSCDRHNRHVHIVAGRDRLTTCHVCVAKSAEVIDGDIGMPSPADGWSTRGPLKILNGQSRWTIRCGDVQGPPVIHCALGGGVRDGWAIVPGPTSTSEVSGLP